MHTATSVLNHTGKGIRTIVGCSCGWMPTKAANKMGTMYSAYQRHAQSHGVDASGTCPTTVIIGPGYAAAGMTQPQWRSVADRCDPYTVAS